MKTLVNKDNPQIRITAPEIEIDSLEDYYRIPGVALLSNKVWGLVEEESKHTEVWVEGRTIFEQEGEPICKESLQVEEEHPDNFTSFEWLVGRLMFRGCDLWGITDGEDDNGIVTKLIKDRAAEMMKLLERELDPIAEPVDLDEDIEMEWDSFNKHVAEYGEESEDVVWLNWFSFVDIACHFYKLGLNARKED